MNKTTLNSQKEKHSMLSLRRATSCHLILWRWQFYFYPRSPCGERRRQLARSSSRLIYFYPRSPCGERPGKGPAVKGYRNFYPRSPCGERHKARFMQTALEHFYPRSPCGERRRRSVKLFRQNYISIHALLAESDE